MEYESGKLEKKDDGNFTYYGEKEFVDRIISAWKAKEQQNKSSSMSGIYGTVYKLSNNVNVEKKQYYVKQIKPTSYKFIENVNNILNEIELSNILTAKVPDIVSNLKGARIINSATIEEVSKKYNKVKHTNFRLETIINPDLAEAYLIYEGHEGKTLREEFNDIRSLNNGSIEKSIEERLNKYLDLVCSAKEAINTLNSAGYSHNDIHLDNIFVINNKGSKKCILIDFGLSSANYKKVTKYSRDIKNLMVNTIGYIFTQKIRENPVSDENNEDYKLVPFETYDFKVYFSIQINIDDHPEIDVYRNEPNDITLLYKFKEDPAVIDAVFKLCENRKFIKYRIYPHYMNEQPGKVIPLETGPHLMKKGWFGGYKKKTRRAKKKRTTRKH